MEELLFLKLDFYAKAKIYERSVEYVINHYYHSNNAYLDCGISRGCKTFRRDKLAKNNNFNVCRFLVHTSSDHFTLSKHPVFLKKQKPTQTCGYTLPFFVFSLYVCRFPAGFHFNFL